MSYIETNHIQEFLMIMSEGPGVAILKFLTFAKKGILYSLILVTVTRNLEKIH